MKKKILTIMLAAALTAAAALPAFAGQWQTGAGGWWYQRDDGSYPANQWEAIDGEWYHFNASGYMQTGWYYEIDKSANEWTPTACYYLDPASGKMLKNTVVNDRSPESGAVVAYHIDGNGLCEQRRYDMEDEIEGEGDTDAINNFKWGDASWELDMALERSAAERRAVAWNNPDDDDLEYQMTSWDDLADDDELEPQMLTGDDYDEYEYQMTSWDDLYDDDLEDQTWGDQGFDY